MKTNTASTATLNTGQDVTLGAIVTGGTVKEVLKAIVAEVRRVVERVDRDAFAELVVVKKSVVLPRSSVDADSIP